MAMQARLQHIGDQHGVIDWGNLDAIARQNAQIIFHILPNLEHGRVFQKRLKPGQGRIHRDLVKASWAIQ